MGIAWRGSIAALALSLAGGCTIDFDTPEDPRDPPIVRDDHETTQVVPQLCFRGELGRPECPLNVVSLETAGADGSFAFKALPRPVERPIELILFRFEITAGEDGLFLEQPVVRIYKNGPTHPIEWSLGADLNIGPGESVIPEFFSASAKGLRATPPVTISFASVGPYRP